MHNSTCPYVGEIISFPLEELSFIGSFVMEIAESVVTAFYERNYMILYLGFCTVCEC